MGRIIIYDGAEEIGGSKILVETGKDKFLLDFGLNYKRRGLYFEEFLNPRVANGLGDLYYLGLIPPIKGLYRKDLTKKLCQNGNEELGKGDEPSPVDCIFVSHAHFDHSAYISMVREDIPIFASSTTIALLKAMEESGATNFETSMFKFIKRDTNSSKNEEKYGTHDIRSIDSSVHLTESVVSPFSVDHSVPGAVGFVIQSPQATIVYSGDLRLHGKRRKDTEKFVHSAKESKPDFFLVEGTNLGEKESGEFWTEQRVYEEANEVFKKSEGLIIVNFSIRDVDRFLTFYELAKAYGRKFVLTLRDAYLLKAMREIGLGVPGLDDPSIYFYLEKRRSGTYCDEDYREAWFKNIFTFIDSGKLLKASDIKKNEKEFLIILRFFDLQELVDIQPRPGSVYIHSSSEAHTEEQTIDETRLDNWLKAFGLPPKVHIHASGHAKREDIFGIIQEINAKVVLPIHTEHSEEIKKQFPDRVRIVKNFDIVNI